MAFNSNFKAILFDADGVLFDACDVHYEALNKALSFYGVHIGEAEHNSSYNGLPTSIKLDKLVKQDRIKHTDIAPISKLKQHFTQEMLKAKLKYDKEKCLLMQDLREHGYLTGICSNCQVDTLYLMVKQTGLYGHIDLILSASGSVLMKSKPSPDVYNTAMSLLNCNIFEVVVIEDTELGVKAAKDATIANVHKVNGPADVTREFFVKLNLLPALK